MSTEFEEKNSVARVRSPIARPTAHFLQADTQKRYNRSKNTARTTHTQTQCIENLQEAGLATRLSRNNLYKNRLNRCDYRLLTLY